MNILNLQMNIFQNEIEIKIVSQSHVLKLVVNIDSYGRWLSLLVLNNYLI